MDDQEASSRRAALKNNIATVNNKEEAADENSTAPKRNGKGAVVEMPTVKRKKETEDLEEGRESPNKKRTKTGSQGDEVDASPGKLALYPNDRICFICASTQSEWETDYTPSNIGEESIVCARCNSKEISFLSNPYPAEQVYDPDAPSSPFAKSTTVPSSDPGNLYKLPPLLNKAAMSSSDFGDNPYTSPSRVNPWNSDVSPVPAPIPADAEESSDTKMQRLQEAVERLERTVVEGFEKSERTMASIMEYILRKAEGDQGGDDSANLD